MDLFINISSGFIENTQTQQAIILVIGQIGPISDDGIAITLCSIQCH